MQLYSNIMNSSRNVHSLSDFSDFSNPAISTDEEKKEKAEKIDFIVCEQSALRRIRNSNAVRRSRQTCRIKGETNRIHITALEQENSALRAQINVLKKELEHVQQVILITNINWKNCCKINFR